MNRKPATMLWELIGRLGNSCLTFRISGEAGVGKEAIAHLIHRHYPHETIQFVKINCQELQKAATTNPVDPAALPTNGLLSELNSPAYKVFYLENIEALPTEFQSPLLNMLNKDHPTAPPWVFASSLAPLELCQSNPLDPALSMALDTVHIAVPPLRQHPDKIPQILSWFLHTYSQKAPEGLAAMPDAHIMDHLLNYQWPGNLRQLQQLACKAFKTSDWEGILKDLNTQTFQSDAPNVDEIAAIYLMSLAKLSIHKEKIIEAFMAASETEEVGLLDLAIYHEAVSQIADHIGSMENDPNQNE